MKPAFSDMLKEYIELLHTRAVYSTMANFLRRYVENDLGPPKEAIEVTDGVFSVVKQEVISTVLDDIEAQIRDLSIKIDSFEALSKEEPAPKKKAVKKSKKAKATS